MGFVQVVNRRFHCRGRHLVGRAKNSDGLGRVIVSVQNGGCISFHGQRNIRISRSIPDTKVVP